MLQAAVATLLGPRVAAGLLFPLGYMLFLVPFGDEIVPALQAITAKLAVALTHASGVPAVIDGVFIDTPVGLFEVAEACSGVKFLVAMVALGTLVAHLCFASWKRRAAFMLAAVVVPVLANGVRAWGTIYVAQSQGIEFAAGFDHIVYGWIFFALVMAAVLGASWRFFDRSPDDPLVDRRGARGVAAARAPGALRIGGWHALAAILVLAAAGGWMDRIVACRNGTAHVRDRGDFPLRHDQAGRSRAGRADVRRARPSRARRLGRVDRAGRRPRPSPPGDHRPRRLAAADAFGRRPRGAGVQRRDLQLPRAARASCEALGAEFRTDGDSEVILAAWQRWGVDCLPRLHGMFAFAIYDTEARTLFLARDRLGVKPLFMAHLSDGSLAFASELKGLLAHPLLRREADPLAVEDYLAWGYVPDHRSILKGVEKLPGGPLPPAAPRRAAGRAAALVGRLVRRAPRAAPSAISRPSCCTTCARR